MFYWKSAVMLKLVGSGFSKILMEGYLGLIQGRCPTRRWFEKTEDRIGTSSYFGLTCVIQPTAKMMVKGRIPFQNSCCLCQTPREDTQSSLFLVSHILGSLEATVGLVKVADPLLVLSAGSAWHTRKCTRASSRVNGE